MMRVDINVAAGVFAAALSFSCAAQPFEVVPPARTDGTQTLAVEELRHHLARKAKVVPYRFVFARPADAPEAGPFESRYRVKDGTVWFWGDDSGPDVPWDWGDNRGVESMKRNGTLFAVELFADRELGMRFVWPGEGGVVVTPVERLALRDGAEGSFTTALAKGRIRNYREYKPMPWSEGLKRIMPRELYDAPKPFTFEERDLWLKRNRLQDREFFHYGHSFTHWKDRFIKTHPEFLNLHVDPKTGARERGYVHGKEGSDRTKLCVSNEAVVDQVVADWMADGAPRFLSICENDSGNWCECDNCRALDVVKPGEAPYSFLTDRYVNFWNRVAKKARAVRPDVMLTTYIYSAYRYPPRRERVEYGENMLFGFVCGPTEDAMGMIRAWEAAGMKRFFFRPNYLHTLSCIQRGYEKFFFDQFHEMLDHGMFGVDYDANDFRYASAIEFYVLARAFSDPKADFETIMDDYASAYGAAADAVKEYYAAIREVGEAQRERRMKALAAESEMDEIRRKAFPRDIEDGRSEEELRAKKEILSRALARHAAAGDLRADERARLENLVLQAEHAILTFRFMSGIDTLPVEELRSRGEALLAFRLEHRSDMPDIYSHVFGLSRPESRYWSLYAKRLKDAASAGLSPEEFRSPPPSARPHTWWHWMNGNVTKEGITADLEAMARAGIGGAQIFDAGLALPKGPVDFATDAWFDCLVHADREAKRLGIELCIANCSGWTSSAGPWITPELSMKYVECSSVEVKGGSRFEGALPHPAETNGFYMDIAVLAMPTPAIGRPVLRDMPDFDLQVFRKRGSDRFGAKESGPQLPSRVTPAAAPQEACVAGAEIVDLTSRMGPGGVLSWEAPPSHSSWTVLRIGFAANGRTNRSASQAGLGLECDKLDPHALDVHFDAYVGRLLKMLPRDRALKGVLIDSYEVFGQNWTRGFDGAFAGIAGYSITNFLPVLAGYPVDSAARTDAFLRDFRRAISTVFCRSYPGRMRERCAENGLELYCEPYGNGPFNDLEYARECDVPMAEFWRPRDPGCDLAALARDRPRTYMECRWGNKALGNGKTVAATAHVWGRRVVGAEAFTSAPDSASGRWLASPFSMKLQCDRVFSEGVNRMIFHRYAHQPWTSPTRYPGMTMAAYGAHLERTQTWWNHGAKEFFAYMSRAQHLLQSGVFAGDVLVCTPGEAPEYGTEGEIPEGYDGDRCHPAALSAARVVEGGVVVVPGGTRYRVVCVPESPSAAVAASAVRLASAGASVVAYGEVAAALERAGCAPDFLCDDRDVTWMHRRAGRDDYYFVAVPNAAPKKVRCSFRDGKGRAPQLWDPVTGGISSTPFETRGGRTELVLDCTPVHSVFVVFRDAAKPAPECASAEPESVTEIPGSWKVSFREPGAADDVAVETFETLSSWTASANPDVRYFSGTATYRKRVDISSGGRVILDLGDVREIAEVAVNGRAYPALWKPPYRVDITDALSKGASSADIEIKVTNLWPNRLIGDAALADDSEWDDGKRSKGYPLVKEWPGWLLRGEPSPTGRHAFSTCRLWTADAPLLVSGLLGPVRIERR